MVALAVYRREVLEARGVMDIIKEDNKLVSKIQDHRSPGEVSLGYREAMSDQIIAWTSDATFGYGANTLPRYVRHSAVPVSSFRPS